MRGAQRVMGALRCWEKKTVAPVNSSTAHVIIIQMYAVVQLPALDPAMHGAKPGAHKWCLKIV